MFVVGTAGHVDHGKSTLIKALTGIDPDRLREEKERGMTIDLGFAWLNLPSGREVSIVDVPGHERFIRNMLAGVGGIDLAMLVVAADEGVMPQTREHLAIIDLLRIKAGIVALTKKDLVEPDWLELVQAELAETLESTALAGAPLVAVSAVTGDGLPQLLSEIDRLLEHTPAKRNIGRPRLPIDRVFTIPGFGTIVTGTLVDGSFQVGQEVEIQPRGLRTRVRTLQTHKHKVETALPGSRVAINLAGVATEEVARGDVVSVPRWLTPTQVIDVQLRALPSLSKALEHGGTLSVHTGSAEVECRLSLLDRDELAPGETGWAQLRLLAPIAVVKGDFFVVRTPNTTVGGGEIVDVHPRRHRRFQEEVAATLSTKQTGEPADLVRQALLGKPPLDLETVARQAGLTDAEARSALEELLGADEVLAIGGYYVDAVSYRQLLAQTQGVVRGYHSQFPLRRGIGKEELKSRLGLAPRLFAVLLERWLAETALFEEGSAVRVPEHRVTYNPEQEAKIARLFELMRQARFSPPGRAELEQQIGLEPAVTDALAEQGRFVKLTEAVILPVEVYVEMVEGIKARLNEEGRVTVATVRDQFGTSRKYALAILEHLDERRVTRRVGDERVLR
ncbi:MAG: selenocysteine-specific translation elongation factor [Chloroflexota bacterium]